MVVPAGRRRRAFMDRHPARHAEMDDQYLAVIQFHQDKFRAPPDMDDPPPAQPLGHAFGQGKAQVRAALHHVGEQAGLPGRAANPA